jgi:cytoskeletal protein CcmA (bactofilin family)
MDSKEFQGSIVIGEGVSVNGALNVPGKAIINGSLQGELIADELTVGQKGKLLGKVAVRRADVHGESHDSISASEHLIIRSTGQIHGVVSYGNIEIERGGLITGKIGPKPVAAPDIHDAEFATSKATASTEDKTGTTVKEA